MWWREGFVTEVGRSWAGAVEVEVSVGDTAVRALAYPDLVGTPAVADRVSVPIPGRGPCGGAAGGPSGSRATPARQPPSARLLLSAVVTTVRSGAKSTGLAIAGAGSKTRSR